MNYLNIAFKLAKFHAKTKKKYDKILKKSKDFPSFLSTKHFYKRRKAFFINNKNINDVKHINIKSAKKKETNLMLSNLATKRKTGRSNQSQSKINDSLSSNDLLLESDNNNISKIEKKRKKIDKNSHKISLSVENNNKGKRKKTLSEEDKIKLKSILQNFQKNKLTTENLCKQEKKLELNSLSESNFLFLFGNYKDKYSHKKRMKHLIYNKTTLENMPKMALISMDMMKKFNQKTNQIYEEEKLEGIKYSKNINEFRKQIINSYKDKFSKDDISQEKLNYDNAVKYLNTNQENQIKKAYQLEKDFYKTKFKNKEINYQKQDYMADYIGRKNKKTLTNNFKFNSFSSKNNDNQLNFNKGKIFNSQEEEKLFVHSHTKRGSLSYSNANKNNLFLTPKQTNKSDNNNKGIKTMSKFTTNNLFLNYMKNAKKRRINFYPIDISAKKEYKNYIKRTIKERSKQLADSLASINNYYEYQPLKDMNSDMPNFNVNTTNLKRVVKVNGILKNLFSYDDDDLLIHNVKKLKKELRDIELQYYSIDKHMKNYHLSFLKNNVKRTTIEKVNAIKNPRFGVPC